MWAMLPARERNDYIFTTRQKNSNSDEIFSGKETQKSQFLYNEFYKSFFFEEEISKNINKNFDFPVQQAA